MSVPQPGHDETLAGEGLTGIRVRCSGMDEVQAEPAPDVYLTAPATPLAFPYRRTQRLTVCSCSGAR